MPDRQPIVPEDITSPVPGYMEGHWNYPRRCSDVEAALTYARERAGEWDRDADAHGWWHERPHWIALHNEVLRLRGPAVAGFKPREHLAWLMWCYREGYGNPADRASLTNWMADDPATLHPDDVRAQRDLLTMADEVLALLATGTGAGDA